MDKDSSGIIKGATSPPSRPLQEEPVMFAPIRPGLSVGLLLAGATLVAFSIQETSVGQQETGTKAADQQLSGPFHHDNLTICLIHGEDRLKRHKFLMLAEALEQKKLVIYETQKVTELRMENLADVEVVILSGDILKGGQQDRIAQYDQIVPAKSGKLPLTVFCVERTASRWMKPLTSKDKTFDRCDGQICSNGLRVANRYNVNQSEVWKDVMNAQDKLSANAKVDVKAKESDSSLALSLKVKEVQQAVDKYVSKLSATVAGKEDVVGYAFAINGKVLSADVYGSPVIFRKVWPHLLKASALEAFAELPRDGKFSPATIPAFRTFLDDANKGKLVRQEDTKGLRQKTNEKARILFNETNSPGKALLRSQSFKY
jgi:hypothetical protein